MKIKKSQLRRIIVEEKTRLNEGMLDTTLVQADSGPVRITTTYNDDGTNTATIGFDRSYQIRLDQRGLDSLRRMIHDAMLEVMANQ